MHLGSIHIYTLCRKLISVGLSSRVLEYLIWACICMESSVPLMTVKYLSWRSELYAAACQCYYDLKADVVAEEFAKRGLQKVNLFLLIFYLFPIPIPMSIETKYDCKNVIKKPV